METKSKGADALLVWGGAALALIMIIVAIAVG
jgi:hypothetical protein